MTIVYAGQNRKNAIINGDFDIWQRGTSQTTEGYGCADRWYKQQLGTTSTSTQQTFAIGQTDVPDNPKYYYRIAVTSSAGSFNNCLISQRIESVYTFAGEIVTLSFWAKADASRPIAISKYQSTGSGDYESYVTQFNLTTSWQRFTVTFTVPTQSSVSGTAHFLAINFWFDAGSSLNAYTGSLGQQSGTFDLSHIQLEKGTIATKFDKRTYQNELALCQRYYEIFAQYSSGCNVTYKPNGDTRGIPIKYNVVKRTTPTITSQISYYQSMAFDITTSYGAPNPPSTTYSGDERSALPFMPNFGTTNNLVASGLRGGWYLYIDAEL